MGFGKIIKHVHNPINDLVNMRQTIAFPENVGLVSIRFDDNSATVYNNAYPILKARALPCTMSFVADRVGNYSYTPKCTDAQILEMAKNGFELASHSYVHEELPTTEPYIYNEVVASKLEWENSIGFYVRTFVEPGTWQPAGYSQKNSPLGQTILDTYTFHEGYETPQYGTVRPNVERFGYNHYTCDNLSLAEIQNLVDEVAGKPKAVVLLFHFVEQEGNSSISIADFTTLCDYLKTLRDAGTIDVVTDSGLMGASLGTSRNLIYNPGFEVVDSDLPVGYVASGVPTIGTTSPHGGTNYVTCNKTNYIFSLLGTHGMNSPVFRFSCWHRSTEGGTARLFATAVDYGTIIWSAVSTATWQKLEGIFACPIARQEVKLWLQPLDALWVDYDDLSLVRIG